VPKIVDHDLQKEKFIGAAMRLIASKGLEGVTMRAVAAEAGLSYGSLFHYFDSKDDLLMHAVRYSTSAQTRRVNEYSSQYSGLKALEHLLCDDVIINESSRDSWMVWMTFLYKAAVHKPFAEMNTELIDGWLDRIAWKKKPWLPGPSRRASDRSACCSPTPSPQSYRNS
jgi:DNA-binding transcriptional regulator YbjK